MYSEGDGDVRRGMVASKMGLCVAAVRGVEISSVVYPGGKVGVIRCESLVCKCVALVGVVTVDFEKTIGRPVGSVFWSGVVFF